MKNTLIILTLGLTMFSCGNGQLPSAKTDLVVSKIVGGTEVVTPTAFSKRTVGLFNIKKNSICTGAIIGADLILTAAHCVYQAAASDILISFGPKLNDSKYPNYVADKIIVHDGYNSASESVEDDVALIRLKKEIPSTHAILDLEDSRQLTLKKNDIVTSLGFGVTKTGFFTSGTGKGTLRVTTIPLMIYQASEQKIYLDQRQGSGICYGDSGGPTFTVVNNKPVLVGIASHVSMDEKTKRKNECHMVSALSNPNYFYDWIEDAKLKI